MSAEIPLNTWLMHKQSENIFKVTKIHALHVETVDLDDGRKGATNKYILTQDLAAGRYLVDQKGSHD